METEQQSAALRALSALEVLAQAEGPVSLTEMIAATGLPKATTHRLLVLLEGAGMVVREPAAKRYAPGTRLATLALTVLTNSAWRAPRHAILQSLVAEIGETCNLTLLDGAEVVYLDRVEAAWPLRLHFQVGSRVPAHASASGKLLLALLPARSRQRLVNAMPLTRYTPNTLADARALEAALVETRKLRLGTDHEEYLTGTVCVAVPVEDKTRRIPAALAVHAPVTRMSLKQALAHVPALRRAAGKLAQTFGE